MIIYLKDTMDDLQTFVVTGTTEISNSASTQNMVSGLIILVHMKCQEIK